MKEWEIHHKYVCNYTDVYSIHCQNILQAAYTLLSAAVHTNALLDSRDFYLPHCAV